MSADLPSSNPFRRKAPATAFQRGNPPPTSTASLPPLDTINIDPLPPVDVHHKAVKKVRIQSPHSPPGPAGEPYFHQPLQPILNTHRFPELRDDTFDHADDDNTDESDTEEMISTISGSGAPANPFSKTLATLERTEGDKSSNAQDAARAGTNATRASMDVNAFQRMLMTGNSGARGSSATGQLAGLPAGISFGVNDGSSTDTSSHSRHSVFEAIQDAQPESPRTSHDISDADEERRRLRSDSAGTTSDRKKPPPPSSRHGKLIKVELADSGDSAERSSLRVSSHTPPLRSPIDVHKPLPAAPSRASHESDRDSSIFDREALGKTPEPPSPTQSIVRKGPPPPPMRRHSQLVADSKLSAPAGGGRLSPNLEEDSAPVPGMVKHAMTSPLPMYLPPPPPPTRRPASIRNSSYGPLPQSPGTYLDPDRPTSAVSSRAPSASAPLPPPSRNSSVRHSGRPPSISSVDMSSSGKRSGMTPPPPPPPRQRASSRNSMDGSTALSPGSGRTSGEYFRRSIDSNRRPSVNSQLTRDTAMDDTAVERSRQSSADTSTALTDLAKLQKEIEDLRRQSERRVG